VAVQFGYIGLRLWERFDKVGLAVIRLLGAINIPFYEEMARRIHWWQYSGCRMISFTPWYIILGEFGIAIALALLAATLRRGSWHQAVIAGIGGGLSIFVCYAIGVLDYGLIVRQRFITTQSSRARGKCPPGREPF
jgi:hypothetical protein